MIALKKMMASWSAIIVAPPAEPEQVPTVSVLVFEDDPTRQDDFLRPILAAGAEVEIVSTQRQALRRIEDGNFDIMLVDGTAYSAVGKLILETWVDKGSGPSAIFSTNVESPFINEILRAGADTVMTRPFDAEAFARVVGRFIRQVRQTKQIEAIGRQMQGVRMEQYRTRQVMIGMAFAICLLFVPAAQGFPEILSVLGGG